VKRSIQAFTHLDGWDLELTSPVRLKTSQPTDGDFLSIPRDGFMVINPTTGELWARVNGVWQKMFPIYAVWVGQINVVLTAQAANFATIAFPAGRFTQPPIVFCTQSGLSGGTQRFISKVNDLAVTTLAADIYCYTGDGTVQTGTALVNVLAVQMTPSSRTG
jgi:hypothetical protein